MISRLFIFEFFQGAAIATYFLASISLFVHRLPATELPKVFVLSAFLLWIFGYVYNRLEHRFLTRQVIFFVLTFNAIVILSFRVLVHFHEEKWFLYSFLSAYNILYLLNNLEFWGLVALLFDVRQSKRLFAIVSSWDGPARMSGYAIAGAFAIINGENEIATTEELLVIATIFMGIALLLFIPMARSRDMQNIAPAEHHHYATQNLQQIQASLSGSQLIRNAALVSFFGMCFYLITNFVLYAYLKKQMKTDVSLYFFFTVFLILSRGLTLIIKPLFVNRLLDQIGLRKSLLIAPVILFILAGLSIFFGNLSTGSIFYLYLVMAISTDILRSAIQSPVLLATLQPLPTHQRLKGHTIIKGLMDPFAFLAIGLFLLAFVDSDKDINLLQLSIVLILIAGCWIFFAFSVDSNYIRMLTAAIRKRILNARDISITDVNSLNFLLNRIENGSEDEVIAVLNVISTQPVNKEKFYSKALRHSSSRIKEIAMRYVQSQEYRSILPELKKMLDQNTDQSILPQLIKTVAALDKSEDLSHYFEHENQDVSNAAVMAWLTQDDGQKKKDAENHVSRLFESNHTKQVLKALQIVGELKVHKFADQVKILIGHPNETIFHQAIKTAGRLASESLIRHLLDMYMKDKSDKHVLEALQSAGDLAVPSIGSLLAGKQKPESAKRMRLFALLGRIGGKKGIHILEQSLKEFPEDASAILSALYQLHYSCDRDDPRFHDLLAEALGQASSIVHYLRFLESQPKTFDLVRQALLLELSVIKTRCLWMFSFLYGAEKIRQVKSGFDANTKESKANAFELIEMSVPKEFSTAFITIFERSEPVISNPMKKFFHEPILSIQAFIRRVLIEEPVKFGDWTKATILYSLRARPDLLMPDAVSAYLKSENPMLKEMAVFIKERNHRYEHPKNL
jgi:ATP:ADP antiporter, AAA family